MESCHEPSPCKLDTVNRFSVSGQRDSPVSRAVHGGQWGQVVGAAQVPVQSVLPRREVGGGGCGEVLIGRQEIHRGAVMVAARAGVQA